jgi:hypothetical protein
MDCFKMQKKKAEQSGGTVKSPADPRNARNAAEIHRFSFGTP